MSIDYKIILIGNSNVGKTSIFRKLSTGDFNPKSISTIGLEKKTMEMTLDVENKGKKEKKNFNIHFFDTAGQEKFRAITKSYFKGSDGIILIYDITKRLSFEHISIWIETIKESLDNSSKYVIFLLGNKSDLVDDNGGTIGCQREVTEEEAIKLCEDNNLVWGGEHSVKTIDYDELKKLFESYVLKIYDIVGIKIKKTKKIDNYRPKRKIC